jgi:6-phosphofructokinase 2
MSEIVTLTINPAIDTSTSVDRVVPLHKLRCAPVQRDPGGGGINVARVVTELGGDVEALYPAGGATGGLLRRLIDRTGVPSLSTHVSEETREDFTVFEETTGQQYRFVLPGPQLSNQEWERCLDVLAALKFQPLFIVASGSLPPGVPADFYARAGRIAKDLGAKMILDTSGAALEAALNDGIYLVKPNLRELSELTHLPLDNENARIEACRRLVDTGRTEAVALTLGDQGALLVTRDQVWRAQPLPIKPVSAVGAGDSFLGAMVWSLASGHSLEDAFRYGIAAGSAALLSPGTGLCCRKAVERLYPRVIVETISVSVRSEAQELR